MESQPEAAGNRVGSGDWTLDADAGLEPRSQKRKEALTGCSRLPGSRRRLSIWSTGTHFRGFSETAQRAARVLQRTYIGTSTAVAE